MTLAEHIFRPKRLYTAWLGTSIQTIVKYMQLAACVAWKSSIVSRSTTDSVYQLVFGEDTAMLFPDVFNFPSTRVAITTYSMHDSACSLITTYNRPIHNQYKPYQWLQSDEKNLQVKVWEA